VEFFIIYTMSHIQFLFIKVPEAQKELLIAQLSLLDFNGIEEVDEDISVFFVADKFPIESCVAIAASFDLRYEVSTIEEVNWNEEWEKNFQPLLIDGFCSIRAHFHPQPEEALYDIIITPKMSFGTGHHATTALMISMMRTLDFGERSVFDYGTGTGILAILAEKLGAASVFAIDIDKWSVENAAENFQFNSSKNIKLKQGTLQDIQAVPFDIILANINRSVLLDSMTGLHGLLVPKGLLLLSGILDEDRALIERNALDRGFVLLQSNSKNNWSAMLFQRHGPDAYLL